LKKAIGQAQSLLLGGSTGTPRRDTPPFQKADRNSGEETAETIREEPVSDPFADLKRRMNTPSETASPVSPEPVSSSREPEEDVPLQSEDELIAVPDVPLPLETVQEKLIEFFRSTRNMLASAIAQTYDWKDSGSVVNLTVGKPFLYTTIKQDASLIAASISRLLCKTVSVEVRLDKNGTEEQQSVTEIPEQVEKIRQMFKGIILGEEDRK